MVIERTEEDIIIKIPSTIDITGVQRLIDYLRYKEIGSKSKATEDQITTLARKSKAGWWKANRKRFVK